MKEERSRKKTKQEEVEELIRQNANKVIVKSVEKVLHESMLPYSEFVILDRALPRVEDGLKPVQRRVLYSMYESGNTPDKPLRKSANIVGACMGAYHPHGDSSIYDTLVRMAQPFNMGEILIEGHGNFGSVDGDSAAAMRYTESRLSPIALEMLRDIEKDTVTWSLNYDDSRQEPEMLPGRFPNLLVNGATGIAVGLATNIPTHNLKESCNAVIAYIDNPNIDIDSLMKIIPGPDFPTGGYILKTSECKQVFETGKGKIIMRAKLNVEISDDGKKNIVITELPYQVNKAVLLQRIAKLSEDDSNGPLSYIYTVVDESDRSGMRAVIKLKKDANVNAILASLYKNTDLQKTFNANIVAIADGKPKVLSLKDILEYYVKFQEKVIYNRTKFDLDTCTRRAHILEGLLIAINNIDEVIKIIKKSKSTAEAKSSLIERFNLSEIQAQAILDMRLAKLTSLEVEKIIAELEELRKLIGEYQSILSSNKKVKQVIKKELTEIRNKYGSERKCEFIDEELESTEQLVQATFDNAQINLVYSAGGTLKAIPQKSYNLSTKELSVNPSVFEVPVISFETNQSATELVFTNLGYCHRLQLSKLELAKFKDKGTIPSAYIKNFEKDEVIIKMLEIDETINATLIFTTKQGMLKVTNTSEFISNKQTIQAIKLREYDEVVNVEYNNENYNIAMFTKNGMALITTKDDITPTARVGLGVKGIALNDGDYVIASYLVKPGDAYAIIQNNGFAKVIKQNELSILARNRKGTRYLANKNGLQATLVTILDRLTNYVVVDSNDKFVYVECKKLALDNRNGLGKSVLPSKKENAIKNAYPYCMN